MLHYLKEYEAEDRVEQAVAAVIAEGRDVTYDMKSDKAGGVGTSRVVEAIIEKWENNPGALNCNRNDPRV